MELAEGVTEATRCRAQTGPNDQFVGTVYCINPEGHCPRGSRGMHRGRSTSGPRETLHTFTESEAEYPNRFGVVTLPDVPEPASVRQVGGDHYRTLKIQPWDIIEAFELDYFTGNVVNYVLRAGSKGSRLEDLKKAEHYLAKVIEIEEAGGSA